MCSWINGSGGSPLQQLQNLQDNLMTDPSTKNLRLYAIDITSALASALAVAPFIAIIDQGG